MSKEVKPQIYYFIRRGLYDQLINLCDVAMAKKGKDPMALYWKAFGLGMTNNIPDCIQLLESFQSRRDMQYPVSLALLFFQQRKTIIDQEAIESLHAELSIAEDVTKEAGLALAARFTLFTGDFSNAKRLSDGLLKSCNGN